MSRSAKPPHDNKVEGTAMDKPKSEPTSFDGALLKINLNDASLFSYAGLCMISLRRLFEDEWHRGYKSKLAHQLNAHLDLATQVRESMEAMLNGEGLDELDPFVSVLLDDPFLEKSGLAVVFDLLTFVLKDGVYDARSRALIKHVAWYLHVKWESVEGLEASIVENLVTRQYAKSEEEEKEKAKQAKKQKMKRIALIGLATIGGGTLIGLTGGLAAPLVAAGAGAIIGGAGAAALGSVAGVAIIGSLFGVAGAGLAGYKMKKRVGAVEEFEFEPLVHGSPLKVENTASRQLHITIAVTGWLNNEVTDVRQPWRYLADSKEQYCLRWETQHLLAFGTAFDYILNFAMSVAAQEALKYTVLSGLLSAIMWPAALVSAAGMIDNPWSVCLQRSEAAGKQLAEVLLSREQGQRPVNLIGYSLGARVIFSCLEELSKRKGCEGIIEDVILLGAPVSGSVKNWEPFARVVSGKIVNGYCRGDWLLKFLYRTSSAQLKIAGLHSVRWENRRMFNIDLSDLISGHGDYLTKLNEILNVIGVRMKQEQYKRTGFIIPDDDITLPSRSQSEVSVSNIKLEQNLSVENKNASIRHSAIDDKPSTGSIQCGIPEGIDISQVTNLAQENSNISERTGPKKEFNTELKFETEPKNSIQKADKKIVKSASLNWKTLKGDNNHVQGTQNLIHENKM